MIELGRLTDKERENLAKLQEGGAGGKLRGDVSTRNIKEVYSLGSLSIRNAFLAVLSAFKSERKKVIPRRSAQPPPKADGE
jgi:hypothetical protein